jgi:hypothetical protein
MILFYLLLLTFVAMVAYAGYDATMRLVSYIDVLYRYQIVKVQMYLMKKNLERQLLRDQKQFLKQLEKQNG